MKPLHSNLDAMMTVTKKTVFTGHVEYVQVIDEQGRIDEKQEPKLSNEELKSLFEDMLLTRIFDEKCLKLQRSGKLGTFAQILGQEAQVSVAYAMAKTDWLVPCFRENGIIISLGAKMEEILLAFGGDERGMRFSNLNILPIAIPIATQLLHGVGVAWAMQKRKEKNAVVTVFGDGATSEGDFHEAMNFAGIFKLPVVFLCQNNQWAISVPRKIQTASATIAQKALAYGFEGIQIDGNDPLAVYKVVKEALEKARSGGGPTLIEMMTYRMGDHTTADDATKYRPPEELEYWKKRDPIDRMRMYLKAKKLWSESFEDKLATGIRVRVEDAVQKYEAYPKPAGTDMFDYLAAERTPELERQRAYYLELSSKIGNPNPHK